MTEYGNKIINLRTLDVQTLGHYWFFMIISYKLNENSGIKVTTEINITEGRV